MKLWLKKIFERIRIIIFTSILFISCKGSQDTVIDYEINPLSGLKWLQLNENRITEGILSNIPQEAKSEVNWDDESEKIDNILIFNKSYYLENKGGKVRIGDSLKHFLTLFPSAVTLGNSAKFSDEYPAYRVKNTIIIFDQNKKIDSFFLGKSFINPKNNN